MNAIPPEKIYYPDSDGQPMADNTRQADEIVWLKTNLDELYADNPEVFVAMDLLWYPVEFHPEIRNAPDVFVAFGRPKGHRGSYRQWEEGDTAPQVVFEILSPGNRMGEMMRKLGFYERYGVEEYYLYNPEAFDLTVWQRDAETGKLEIVESESVVGWDSPLLGVRFDAPGDAEWTLYHPNGQPFRSPLEIRRELEQAKEQLEQVQTERDRLAAKLRELGISPDAI
jgi:Uma2 family endonuclease